MERRSFSLPRPEIVTMNVSDDYEYMDEELQEIILGFFEENMQVKSIMR